MPIIDWRLPSSPLETKGLHDHRYVVTEDYLEKVEIPIESTGLCTSYVTYSTKIPMEGLPDPTTKGRVAKTDRRRKLRVYIKKRSK